MSAQVSPTNATIEIPIGIQNHHLNPLPGVTNTIQRKHINLLAYNIFLRPPLVKNNESDHKDARLEEFIKLLPEFDIICLEEMFGFLNSRKHKIIREAQKAGFFHYADSTSPSFFTSFLVDGGLLVLSRFPIVASEFRPYPYGIFSDALAQKGILYVKVQIKDEIVHVFQTHTQASYVGETQRYPIIARGDQLNLIRTFMDECLAKHGKESDVCLLVGDLNIDARNPYIETEKVKKYPMFHKYPHLGEKELFNEYEAMMCILTDNNNDKLEDLLHKTYGEHPITYGDTYMEDNKEMRPLETVLTLKDDLCSNQSLDYIFQFTMKPKNQDQVNPESLKAQRKLNVIEGSAKVEKFFVEDFEFTQISDHYGVMVSLEYTEELKSEKKHKVKHADSVHHIEIPIRLE